jgi:excisionase family DNA binding protein
MTKEIKEFQELKKLTLLGAKQVLTMDDAAILTGLSKSHLYKLVCYKKIPYYKSQGGKLTYFDKEELNKWMLHTRVKTSTEIETEAVNYIVDGKQPKKGGKNV